MGTLPAPTATPTPVDTLPAPTTTFVATLVPPTATASPTRTRVCLRLPLVLKYQRGPDPTATSTPTTTRTATPTCTVQPTPPITQSYGSLFIPGAPTDRPADEHPDLNLSLRSYQLTLAEPELIDLNGETDANAPRLRGLCVSCSDPRIVATYQVYDWDWRHGQRGELINDPAVTLLEIATRAAELICAPQAGYDLGEGYVALVLYARADAITLKYTRDDNVVHGYTLHIEDVQVDPALLALYHNLDQSGRDWLPALRGGQSFGWAIGSEISIAVRDCGSFMDPRSRKDWWQGS